jgi:hypothetical protein
VAVICMVLSRSVVESEKIITLKVNKSREIYLGGVFLGGNQKELICGGKSRLATYNHEILLTLTLFVRLVFVWIQPVRRLRNAQVGYLATRF